MLMPDKMPVPYHRLRHHHSYFLSPCKMPFPCWAFFTLSHLFSQQLCGEGSPVPIWQPEKQRPGRWACQEERSQPHRPTPEHGFSVTLLPASWIYKSLKLHCCFHLIRITKTHIWFRSMTSLLNFFSQTQFLKWRKNKVYSPRPWFEVQDGVSGLHSLWSQFPMNNSLCKHKTPERTGLDCPSCVPHCIQGELPFLSVILRARAIELSRLYNTALCWSLVWITPGMVVFKTFQWAHPGIFLENQFPGSQIL